LRAALAEGDDLAAARVVIDKALAGDAVAARFIVGRLFPCPRGREIRLDLPEGEKAADVLAASNATIAAMAAGEITPDEALTVTRVLDGRLRALKAAAREKLSLLKSHSTLNRKEPSPSGRGQGEGAWASTIGSSVSAAGGPHPGPLPAGEGATHREKAQPFRSRLLHSTSILQHAAPASLTGALAAA
jgi:hypothetical protein